MQFEPQTQPQFSWPHSRFLQEGRKLERDYSVCSTTVLACFEREIGKRAEEQLDNKVDSGREGTYACVSSARLYLKPDVSPRIRGDPKWQIRLPPGAAKVARGCIPKVQHALRDSLSALLTKPRNRETSFPTVMSSARLLLFVPRGTRRRHAGSVNWHDHLSRGRSHVT